MRGVTEYGHVAVFCGGNSSEREISLQSGQAVYQALSSAGIKVSLVDTKMESFELGQYDRGFIALHGRDGEDGKFQAVLEQFGMPYTGSNVSSSSLAMNKWHTKAVWQSINVRTPSYQILDIDDAIELHDLQLPVYVKPVNEGSSIGITYVMKESQLEEAVMFARQYDRFVLVEAEVKGLEYTAVFIQGQKDLPFVRVEPKSDFYDYEAKYIRSDTKYIVSPELPEALEKSYRHQAECAFKFLGLSGWGRVDFMVDSYGKAWFIEVNTVPGMTGYSLVPKSAAAAGMSFSDVCLSILETSYV